MVLVKEFQEKVREMRDKLDFENGTAQKNKTLLLTLKEYCNTVLEETQDDKALGAVVQKELKQITIDMTKIKGISHDSAETGPQRFNVDENIFTAGRPTKEALTSIQAGGFNPESSPILRNLRQRKPYGSKIKKKKSSRKVSPPVSSEPPESDASEAPALDQTEAQIKKLQQSLAGFETAPFPDVTPPQTTQTPHESVLLPGKLIIAQLELEIPVPFAGPQLPITRELLTDQKISMDLPENFFEPILGQDAKDVKYPEHCLIEQPEKGKFVISDRNNAQKTFFKGAFLNEEKRELEPGDAFVLPVLISDQLASLSVEFQA